MLKPQDYASDQEVRWCPGCGDYAILKAMQKTLAALEAPIHKNVFVSGIGCSSRFPYYLNTYGFHTIHGRATTIATGLAVSRPDLTVWVITGDGDSLSIGTNHLIHLMRRNVNVKVLLFNNNIYGLTKGQYSPTSQKGFKNKSAPKGTQEQPIDTMKLALAADCSFYGRAIDIDGAGLQKVFTEAYNYQGTCLIEIFQNCNVFNDGVHDRFASRENRPFKTIQIELNKKLLYGENNSLGLKLVGGELISTDATDPEVLIATPELLEKIKYQLSNYSELVPLGILRYKTRDFYFQGHSSNFTAVAANDLRGLI